MRTRRAAYYAWYCTSLTQKGQSQRYHSFLGRINARKQTSNQANNRSECLDQETRRKTKKPSSEFHLVPHPIFVITVSFSFSWIYNFVFFSPSFLMSSPLGRCVSSSPSRIQTAPQPLARFYHAVGLASGPQARRDWRRIVHSDVAAGIRLRLRAVAAVFPLAGCRAVGD